MNEAVHHNQLYKKTFQAATAVIATATAPNANGSAVLVAASSTPPAFISSLTWQSLVSLASR